MAATTPTVNQRVNEIKEESTYLEESVKEMVSKAVEKTMEAVRLALADWVKESETKAAKMMGLQLSHLPNEDKGEESDNGEKNTHSKDTYSDVSKLLTKMAALQVFDEKSERVFVQKAPLSISKGTNPLICSLSPYWNDLKIHCREIMVYQLHENEYGKCASKFENVNSLRFLFESMHHTTTTKKWGAEVEARKVRSDYARNSEFDKEEMIDMEAVCQLGYAGNVFDGNPERVLEEGISDFNNSVDTQKGYMIGERGNRPGIAHPEFSSHVTPHFNGYVKFGMGTDVGGYGDVVTDSWGRYKDGGSGGDPGQGLVQILNIPRFDRYDSDGWIRRVEQLLYVYRVSESEFRGEEPEGLESQVDTNTEVLASLFVVKQDCNAPSENTEMYMECQELLQMGGLAYIISLRKAEAQCAVIGLGHFVQVVHVPCFLCKDETQLSAGVYASLNMRSDQRKVIRRLSVDGIVQMIKSKVGNVKSRRRRVFSNSPTTADDELESTVGRTIANVEHGAVYLRNVHLQTVNNMILQKGVGQDACLTVRWLLYDFPRRQWRPGILEAVTKPGEGQEELQDKVVADEVKIGLIYAHVRYGTATWEGSRDYNSDLEDKVVFEGRSNVMNRPILAGPSTHYMQPKTGPVVERPSSRKQIYNQWDKEKGGIEELICVKIGLLGRGLDLSNVQ